MSEEQKPEGYRPDSTPIAEGPLKGLPAWVRDLRNMFSSAGQQISELTAINAELQYAISEIGQNIILYMPEEVGRGKEDGVETVTEVAARLIKEYAILKDQHEPMAARLQAAEKELEELRAAKAAG